MVSFKSILIIILLSCSAWPHAAQVTPTENFIAYLSELLEQNVVGDDELAALIEAAEQNQVVNPISEKKAQTLLALHFAHQAFAGILDGVVATEVGAWARAHVKEQERVRHKRAEKDEDTEFPWTQLPVVLAVGDFHACAIDADDHVVCWGKDSDGQRTVPSDLGSVQAVATGNWHTCAVKANAYLACWGDYGSGQTAVPSDLGPVQAVATGGMHTCVVKKAGATVACWGDNGSGQTAVPSDLGPVRSVAAGNRYTCAVKADFTASCWGEDCFGQSTVPSELGLVQSIVAGETNTCALKINNEVVCWGRDFPDKITPPLGLKVKRIGT